MKRPLTLLFAAFVCIGGIAGPGCSSLPDDPPPLRDMEEPLEFQDEPRDEPTRGELVPGAFSGVYVGGVAESLDDLIGDEEPEGLLVTSVVENSPAAFAGLEEGDLLLEAQVADAEPIPLRWPSEWRKLELDGRPGETVTLAFDRAGAEQETKLELMPRLAPADRGDVERFREEDKVGVVLRTATEVEARGAGLGPGGGAVVVGLSRGSPWRAAGLRFGDLIARIDETPVAHPQVVLDAIRAADADDEVMLGVHRGAEEFSIEAPVSRRKQDIRDVSIPPLYSYEAERENSKTKILLGLFGYEETKAAWEVTLLWFITFGGGDADELEEVETPEVEASDERGAPEGTP